MEEKLQALSRWVLSEGDAATFSFSPGKSLSYLGIKAFSSSP